jgi:hypothetical protein
VIGDTFIAQSEQGEIKIPLTFKTKLIRAMPDDLLDLLDQVYYLCAGDTKLIARFDELDITESRTIARKMFQAFRERQQARLGESRRSSAS